MKRQVLLPLIAALVFSTCGKESLDYPVTGKWELVKIENRLLGVSLPKPSISGTQSFHVVIEQKGGVNGNTFQNVFSGSYSINTTEKSMLFENMIFTQIADDTWGRAFIEMTFSCQLQSVNPCVPVFYSFQGDSLVLRAPGIHDFYFVPLR